MENTNVLDLVVGGLAIAILIGGLLMLFNGISAFGGKGK
ncbi:MAG: NAD synthetase [Cyanobacteriota bacterium]